MSPYFCAAVVDDVVSLSLNVATTRLILLQGDAGKIQNTAGDLVVGGNLIVGVVIFLTGDDPVHCHHQGCHGISEVNADHIDAMPGKQGH